MNKYIKLFLKYLFLGFIGGFTYYNIELIYRGYSHISMFLLASFLFILIGLINEFLSWDTPLFIQSIIGAIIVTVFEFITGCIVNLWLGLNIWDYSNEPLNVMGQIGLPFTLIWIVLSCIAIILDDYLRYYIFNEEKPHYKVFYKENILLYK